MPIDPKWTKPDSYMNDNVEHEPDDQEIAAAKRVFGDGEEVVGELTAVGSGAAYDRINALRKSVETALAGADLTDALQALCIALAHGLTYMDDPCGTLADRIVPMIHANVHQFLEEDGGMEGAHGKKLDS